MHCLYRWWWRCLSLPIMKPLILAVGRGAAAALEADNITIISALAKGGKRSLLGGRCGVVANRYRIADHSGASIIGERTRLYPGTNAVGTGLSRCALLSCHYRLLKEAYSRAPIARGYRDTHRRAFDACNLGTTTQGCEQRGDGPSDPPACTFSVVILGDGLEKPENPHAALNCQKKTVPCRLESASTFELSNPETRFWIRNGSSLFRLLRAEVWTLEHSDPNCDDPTRRRHFRAFLRPTLLLIIPRYFRPSIPIVVCHGALRASNTCVCPTFWPLGFYRSVICSIAQWKLARNQFRLLVCRMVPCPDKAVPDAEQ